MSEYNDGYSDDAGIPGGIPPHHCGQVVTKNLDAAIARIMAEVPFVVKKVKIKAGGNQYSAVGERELIQALRPVMIRHGVLIRPNRIEVERVIDYTSNGRPTRYVAVKVQWRIVHVESGEEDYIQTCGEGCDLADKAMAKAQTMAFKYAVRQLFMIETRDDPDRRASGEYARDRDDRGDRSRDRGNRDDDRDSRRDERDHGRSRDDDRRDDSRRDDRRDDKRDDSRRHHEQGDDGRRSAGSGVTSDTGGKDIEVYKAALTFIHGSKTIDDILRASNALEKNEELSPDSRRRLRLAIDQQREKIQSGAKA